MDNVNEFIKSLNISEDEDVVLACSYGPDSMCLLDILIKNGINVIVAHVNHKLREESDQEYVDLATPIFSAISFWDNPFLSLAIFKFTLNLSPIVTPPCNFDYK